MLRCRHLPLIALGLPLSLIGAELPEDIPNVSAEELAKVVCQTCHLRPEPFMLDRKTWERHTLPWMGTKLGMKPVDYSKLPGGAFVRSAQVLPELPVLSSNQWRLICEYYLANAPSAPLPQAARPVIQMDLEQEFAVLKAPFRHATPTTTLVKIVPGGALMFTADSVRRSLSMLDSSGREVGGLNVGNSPVALTVRADGLFLTLIGYVAPSDDPIGRLLFIPTTEQGFGKPRVMLDGLARPCDAQIADLNQDGRDDLVVCQYGNMIGRFSWHEKLQDGSYREHLLREQPGAMYTEVRDLNGDGLPDIISLMAQAQEAIYLYTNRSKGEFDERVLVQHPPAWGMTWFELHDFNTDGFPDLLVTNGDNAEYPSGMKKYHGVRIYLNDGTNGFAERAFFPLNGAYKAVARDFDGDGDLDVAAISFFPDYIKSPQESFVYLRNEGGLRFTAHSFAECTSGRWMVLDAGDLDRDGHPDIVLGAFNRGPQTIPIPASIRERWQDGPSIVILKNRGRRSGSTRD